MVVHHHHSFPDLENKDTYLGVVIAWCSSGWSGANLSNLSKAQRQL